MIILAITLLVLFPKSIVAIFRAIKRFDTANGLEIDTYNNDNK